VVGRYVLEGSRKIEAQSIEERQSRRDPIAQGEARDPLLSEEVLDGLGVGVLVLDPDFGVASVNAASERFFGLRRAELLGKDHRQLIGERLQFLFEDPQGFSERVLSAYKDEACIEGLRCHVLPSGNRQARLLEYYSRPIRSGPYAGGRIDQYYDMTLQQGTGEALKRSEEKYRALVEQVPAITYTAATDEHASTTYISPQIEEVLGFTPEEWLADPKLWSKRLHPDDADRALAELASARVNGPAVVTEYRLLASDGQMRWFRDTTKLVRDESGGAPFYRGVLVDITEHRQAEEALRSSEARFRRLVESSIIGIMICDIHGKVTEANDALLNMLGYSRGDLLFRWDAITPPEWRHTDEAAIDQLQREGIADPWEKEYIHSDGHRVPVLLGVSLLEESSEDCICFVINLTDRKRAEQELRRNERLASIGTLAAGVAHEINNPVGGILMAAQYALESRDDSTAVERALHDIASNATRCGHIVRNVLKFAREQTSPKAPAELNQVVRHAMDLVRGFAEERGSTLEPMLARELPPVVMNQVEVEQVIISLVENAVQAGAGRIILRTEAIDDLVRVAIQDDGSGITQENRQHLFDPFYTTRYREGGSGLGLSIAHGIIVDHGGAIELESEVGRGTTMTISLPRAGDSDGQGSGI
jgi:PAS domain S-box-containing protein